MPDRHTGAVSQADYARLTRERDEALEREKASAEVLRIISTSPGELKPIFQAMLENAVRSCEAVFANLYMGDADGFHMIAAHHDSAAYVAARMSDPLLQPPPDAPLGRLAITKKVVQVADISALPSRDHPFVAPGVKAGYRTVLAIPLLKHDVLIGAFTVIRQKVQTFTEKQIALLQNFAAQAVIAIENTRLLNELRESLQQQTATADVLKVISSSPGDLRPVFDAMLENAVRICEAAFGSMLQREGDGFRRVALHNAPVDYANHCKTEPSFRPTKTLARILETMQAAQVTDMAVSEPQSPITKLGGARTLLNVPMIKENELIGIFTVFRQEVRPFSDKQIALVKNFAAQAVIAIENARLLNELRQRTSDLSESLEQQTATSEVLKVISSSPGEVKTVFRTILENATRICEAKFGTLVLAEDDNKFRVVAMHGAPPGWAEKRTREPVFSPGSSNNVVQATRTRQVQHILDLKLDRSYLEGEPGAIALADIGGARTLIVVPMIKGNEAIGVFGIYRDEVRPFADKQIELVSSFAAQAVIAIENARLLDELRQRTEEVVKLNQQLEQRVADQVGEIERMGRLRRFLPPQVADLIVASGTEKQLESHRREITALFCDLRGFTGFSESSDPEDVMALLAEYHAAIGKIINKYSGTLERYAGDGVMVIFNDPVPVENPALQAVLMALDMRAAIGGLTEKWRDLGHDLGFGIGIAHGFATLGTIGFEGRRDYAAIGTVSNVASRLCDEAKPSQILISPRVRQAVEKAVTVEPVGEFALKGIRRPMITFNVLEAFSSKPN